MLGSHCHSKDENRDNKDKDDKDMDKAQFAA